MLLFKKRNQRDQQKNLRLQSVISRFMGNPLAVLGLILFSVILLATLSVGFFLDYEQSALAFNIPQRLDIPYQ